MSLWSEESISALKGLWGAMPSSRIAARMGITKGMVIGKGHRLGLPPVSRALMCAMRRGVKIHEFRQSKPRRKRVKAMQYPEPEMKLISIVDLTEDTCHWPIGDPQDWDNFRYCGLHKSIETGPYCKYHHTKSMKQFEAVFCDAA